MQKEPSKKFKDIHEYSSIIIESLDQDIYFDWINCTSKGTKPKGSCLTPMHGVEK